MRILRYMLIFVPLAVLAEFVFHNDGATSHTGVGETEEIVAHQPKWSVSFALGILAASTLAIVFMSEFLVGVVEPVAEQLGVRGLFLGVILISSAT